MSRRVSPLTDKSRAKRELQLVRWYRIKCTCRCTCVCMCSIEIVGTVSVGHQRTRVHVTGTSIRSAVYRYVRLRMHCTFGFMQYCRKMNFLYVKKNIFIPERNTVELLLWTSCPMVFSSSGKRSKPKMLISKHFKFYVEAPKTLLQTIPYQCPRFTI